MNIAEASIRYKTVTLVMTVLIIGGGILAYQKLGRLEDPEFTIKEAQVFTFYPGATPAQVAEEVTDELETAIQKMGQLKQVTSISEAGKSTIRVEIKDNYDKHTLPQVWDELRRKVNDAQSSLPPGTATSIVYDDFGDVYGVFYAVYGDGYSYAEIRDHAKLLRRELLLCQDVADVTLYGVQKEVVYVEISRARTAQLGLSPDVIYASLAGQNLVAAAGRMQVGRYYLRIDPTGEFQSVEEIGDLLILQDDATDSRVYLKDIATVYRGYVDPPTTMMRHNGRGAIGVGISTVEGGNVVVMGKAVKVRMHQLEAQTPIGIEVEPIAHQADSVVVAINSFVVSLAEAIAIVIGVLMFAMGLRSGLLIGFILLLTVLGTFIIMQIQGIMLERISLGALIIALGMLVDNAIVVVEGILVNQQRGMGPVEAASKIVKQTVWPLFGATVVAVLAFAAIGVSQDSTGEYCRSLFLVILISLMLSWLLAITVTPLLGTMFLKVKSTEEGADPYGGLLFQAYKGLLALAVRRRWATVALLIAMLVLAIYGFKFVDRSFFPASTRPQFMLHYWLPQSTHITGTQADLKVIEEHLLTSDEFKEHVTDVSSFVGQGALRFLLTYSPEEANSAYGFLLISVNDYKTIDDLRKKLQQYLNAEFPNALSYSRKFVLGPGDPAKIHARFRGPDADVLRRLADQAITIMRSEPTATDIYDDWRQREPMIQPVVAETQARNAGLTRAAIAKSLQIASAGKQVGVYREHDELLSIIARAPQVERADVDYLEDVQIWSPAAAAAIPIRQVVNKFVSSSENAIVRRRNRVPTITVRCDPIIGQASALQQILMPKVEQMFDEQSKAWNLVGYSLEWGGEYEDSADAQGPIAAKMPIIFLMMILVVICLFNSIRQPLVIFLTVPLAIIGVTVGLLATSQPFGFMALLGLLSLVGMLIKNAIVLIDEINLQIAEGKDGYDAIIEAGLSRLRPVSMAAMTTVLGMIPLLADAFFVAMAVTIMFGLTFATVLTLVVVPVLYACFYRVPRTA